MAAIHDRIKQRRTQLNMTLLDVANQLGVKEATVQRYESGTIKNLKYDTITALSVVLKCDPAYLMGWTDEVENLYEKLDAEDKAEIRGEIKQMLKADKYTDKTIAEDISETLEAAVKALNRVTNTN